MPNLTQAKIYRMSTEDGFFYYGSTCSSLSKRKSWHKDMATRPDRPTVCKAHQKFNQTGWGLVKIELVENVPDCKDKVDMRRVEDRYIRQAMNDEKCLNSIRAHVSDEERRERDRRDKKRWEDAHKDWNKERLKQHYEENKETIKQRSKDFYETNKDRISENRKQKYEREKEYISQIRKIKVVCEKCGSTVRKGDLTRHKKTKKCLDFTLR